MNDFANIAFGYSSAEAERSRDPGLLVEGHIDLGAASEEAVNGKKYLFLGYKGAGKSSIAERVELTLADSHSDFVRLISLGDFPFRPFARIIRGDIEAEIKYPTAWSWILLVYMLESFSMDEGIRHPDQTTLQDAISAFRKMGLSPASDPASIVRTSSKSSFRLSLPGKLAEFSWSGSETRPASEIPDFVESLKGLMRDIRSDSRHYLFIDGLDDILTARDIQYQTLSALLFEVGRLNSEFDRYNVPAKIVVLCRTDLFERIPSANKNKLRQDNAVELDWYRDPREPDQSLLLKIAQVRTKRSLKRGVDLFGEFFPFSIDDANTKRALLDMTRHTPRDFLRLLSHIQEFAPQNRKLSESTVKSGMREYSIKYFLPEIRDELSGYVKPDEISQIISALGRLRKRDFRLSELIESSQTSTKPLDPQRIYDIVDAFFQCSALGNIQHRRGGRTYYTFKYRNRHSAFNENEDIMLHRGLWKALNIT